MVKKREIHPTARLLIALHKKDIVCADLGYGEKIFRIESIHEAYPNERFVLKEHNKAQGSDIYLKFKHVYSPEYKVRKVFITPTGKIHDAGSGR